MERNERSSKEKSAEKPEIREPSPNAGLFCTLCGKPATQLVDGEPCCQDHLEQIYEHQVEDYTRKHLANNAWREG